MKIKQIFKYVELDNTIMVGTYLSLWQRLKLLFSRRGRIELIYRPMTYFELTEAILNGYDDMRITYLKPNEKVSGRIERLTVDMASGRYTRSLERALDEVKKLGGSYELFLELKPKQMVGYLYLKEQLH
jgi:hypothetical protein